MNDLTGQVFTRLTVLGRTSPRNNQAYWRCQCSCGTVCEASGQMLRDGRHKSCGCLKRERIIEQSTSHGHKTRTGTTPTYNSWMNAKRRTTNPEHKRWKDWGGRGITMCERWLTFENFLADMGEKPPGMTLERRDNDGNYEPGNCLWASYADQAKNKRNTKLTPEVIAQIRDMAKPGVTIKSISAELGLNRHTVAKALF